MDAEWHVVVTPLAGGAVAARKNGTPESLAADIMTDGFWADHPQSFVPAAAVAKIEFLPG